MTGFDIFAIAFVLLVIVTLFAGIKTVPQGYDWTIERFGKYTRTLSPGLNLIVPYFDRIGRKINMMEQVINIPEQEVITKDNATVTVDGVAFYQVFDAAKASYEVANLNQAITVLTMTNIRSVMGSMDLDQVLSHRDEINERLLRVVDAAVSPWGVKVNRVELQDINPPVDIKEAMEKQMRAERTRRAQIIEAEGTKRAAILEAEGQKGADINQAEGEKQARILRAEGEATARLAVAEAEAEAIQKISSAVADTKADPTQYMIAVKYIETIEQVLKEGGAGSKTVFMPYEASGLMSSVGGLKELMQATKD